MNETDYAELLLTFVVILTFFNVVFYGFTLKLYSEFMKDKSQDARTRRNDGGEDS